MIVFKYLIILDSYTTISSWRKLKKAFRVIITVAIKISSCEVKITITYTRMRFFKFYLELAYAYTCADSVTCTILRTNISS